MEILIGADPELFVRDNRIGEFICGDKLIPGTKQKPFKVQGGAVQVDGTALEFNIEPAATKIQFVGNIARVMGKLHRMVQKDNEYYDLVATPVADFDPNRFRRFSAASKELGCEPDFDAWNGECNPVPEGDRPFRTGSGHIHVGWTSGAEPHSNSHIEVCRRVVQQLDYCLGIYSLIWDPESRRRQLYGRAGAFRPKPYGVEYRVLSNAWLKSEELVEWVYDATRTAMKKLQEGEHLADRYGELARTIINNNQISWFDTYGDIGETHLPPRTEVQ
jgi:hypothetical protein